MYNVVISNKFATFAFTCKPCPIAKHTKVDMIWVAGRSPTLVSHSLRGVAMNLKATTLTYLAIEGDTGITNASKCCIFLRNDY